MISLIIYSKSSELIRGAKWCLWVELAMPVLLTGVEMMPMNRTSYAVLLTGGEVSNRGELNWVKIFVIYWSSLIFKITKIGL